MMIFITIYDYPQTHRWSCVVEVLSLNPFASMIILITFILILIIMINPPTHRWSCVVEEHRLSSYHLSGNNNPPTHPRSSVLG